jgi:uncharacterized repeat protein (TIGR02543 family)
MATIQEILRMSVEERKSTYEAVDIDKVIIDGNVFTDYGAFSFLWEKSYVKSPVRSGNGSISNLNSYTTFITPHLTMNFSLMSIDTYRVLMNLIYSKNEFTVTCYDVVNNRSTTNRMYFSTEEMPKLWAISRSLGEGADNNWVELLGVQEYTVEMVGTNVGLDVVSVNFYDENGIIIPEASQSVGVGEEFIVNYNYIPSNTSKRFEGVWRLGSPYSGALFRNGSGVIANSSFIENNEIHFYAITVDTDEYTLSFSYGNGIPLTKMTAESGGGLQVDNVVVVKNQSIETAISNANIKLSDGKDFTFPTNGTGSKRVEFERKYYEPYEFRGWYWTSEESTATRVYPNTRFDYNSNKTMFQIYKPKSYAVSFVTNTNGISFSGITAEYGSKVALPNMAKSGYAFLGWFTDNEFKTQFSGTMPPYPITLYAKWEKTQ